MKKGGFTQSYTARRPVSWDFKTGLPGLLHLLPYHTTSWLEKALDTVRTHWIHSLLTHPLWDHHVTTAWLGKSIQVPLAGCFHLMATMGELCDKESPFLLHEEWTISTFPIAPLPSIITHTSVNFSSFCFSWVWKHTLNPSILSSNLYQVTSRISLPLFPLPCHFHLGFVFFLNPKRGWST